MNYYIENDMDNETDSDDADLICNERALKIIVAHIIMCADQLRDLGFDYESLRDYI